MKINNKTSQKQSLFIAYKTAAQLINLYGELYLPLFQRLHDEIEKHDTALNLKSIALQVAAEQS